MVTNEQLYELLNTFPKNRSFTMSGSSVYAFDNIDFVIFDNNNSILNIIRPNQQSLPEYIKDGKQRMIIKSIPYENMGWVSSNNSIDDFKKIINGDYFKKLLSESQIKILDRYADTFFDLFDIKLSNKKYEKVRTEKNIYKEKIEKVYYVKDNTGNAILVFNSMGIPYAKDYE